MVVAQLEDKRARLTADALTNLDAPPVVAGRASDDIDITLARRNLKGKFKGVSSKLQLGDERAHVTSQECTAMSNSHPDLMGRNQSRVKEGSGDD